MLTEEIVERSIYRCDCHDNVTRDSKQVWIEEMRSLARGTGDSNLEDLP